MRIEVRFVNIRNPSPSNDFLFQHSRKRPGCQQNTPVAPSPRATVSRRIIPPPRVPLSLVPSVLSASPFPRTSAAPDTSVSLRIIRHPRVPVVPPRLCPLRSGRHSVPPVSGGNFPASRVGRGRIRICCREGMPSNDMIRGCRYENRRRTFPPFPASAPAAPVRNRAGITEKEQQKRTPREVLFVMPFFSWRRARFPLASGGS